MLLWREIFQECMKALPAGPKATMYNDCNEVVAECESVADYLHRDVLRAAVRALTHNETS